MFSGFDADLLGVVGLRERAEHLLRALAGREVRQKLGVEVLDELDPARDARGDHRQRAAVLEPLQKLVALFDDRQVGGEVGVEDLVEARAAAEPATILPVTRLPAGMPNSSPIADADGRRGLHDHVLLRVVERLPDLGRCGSSRSERRPGSR